ncbi:MAG: restriction endonuclease [Betaproteobacteria bacterium]|nr:restriction endonuclease [Betaproteobacteria bacterium]
MAQRRTLFSILVEQPWWVSALAGGAFFAVAQLIFPPVAPWVALPFFVIALYVAYRQMRTISAREAQARLDTLREMSWEQFGGLISDAYRRQGYTVEAAQHAAFDFKLIKLNRVTLLQCRRWKVHQLGVGPLEDLSRAVSATDAYNGICVTAGAVSPKAAQFLPGKPLSLVTGAALATLIGKIKPASNK